MTKTEVRIMSVWCFDLIYGSMLDLKYPVMFVSEVSPMKVIHKYCRAQTILIQLVIIITFKSIVSKRLFYNCQKLIIITCSFENI